MSIYQLKVFIDLCKSAGVHVACSSGCEGRGGQKRSVLLQPAACSCSAGTSAEQRGHTYGPGDVGADQGEGSDASWHETHDHVQLRGAQVHLSRQAALSQSAPEQQQ